MSIKNRAAAIACGLALAATALAPATAFAADGAGDDTGNTGNTGSTNVTVIAEKNDQDEDQLAFEVPTEIAFAAKADGTLVGPSASATKIVNKSVFGIHVTNIDVSAENGWSLVDDAAKSSDDNSISFALNNVKASEFQDVSADASWNMAYAGAQGDSVEVAASGNVSHVTKDLSSAQKAATITWTLAAGSAE